MITFLKQSSLINPKIAQSHQSNHLYINYILYNKGKEKAAETTGLTYLLQLYHQLVSVCYHSHAIATTCYIYFSTLFNNSVTLSLYS